MSREPNIGGSPVEGEHIDEVFAATLDQILREGHDLEGQKGGERASNQASKEIINFRCSINNARDRILVHPERHWNAVEAVARLTWMIAGSDRLADIAFYQQKVGGFSDNGISVPGSNYGMRLVNARPGVNQLEGVINTLSEDLDSRRAATVIWSPEDAVRQSNDIPCAFGTFYHVRGGRLIATTQMRSNNAYLLMPFNVFEFSMLAEIVAASVGVELGPYVHSVASMHIYARDWDRSQKMVELYKNKGASWQRRVMPSMPRSPKPLEQAYELAKLEAQLRNEQGLLKTEDADSLMERGSRLNDYWRAFYRVLLTYTLEQLLRPNMADAVANLLPPYFRTSVVSWLEHQRREKAKAQKPKAQMQLDLDLALPPSQSVDLTPIQTAFATDLEEDRLRMSLLEHLCHEIQQSSGTVISLDEFRSLRQRFVTQAPLTIAARSNPGEATAQDRIKLSREEVEQVLAEVRAPKTPPL